LSVCDVHVDCVQNLHNLLVGASLVVVDSLLEVDHDKIVLSEFLDDLDSDDKNVTVFCPYK
jgi:hypothetical protein